MQDKYTQQKQQKKPQKFFKNRWTMVLWIVAGIIVVNIVAGQFFGETNAEEISYTQFKGMVRNNDIKRVTIQGTRITASTTSGMDGSGEAVMYITHVPSVGDPELLELLENQNVEVTVKPESDGSLLNTFFSFLPFLFLIWIFFTFSRNMRNQGRGLFNIGQSRAALYKKSKESVTLDDVAGLEGPKAEIKEIIDYLKNPEPFKNLGARTPKGVLLIGPPGTGKTLLARAVAGEAETPFYSITGSDFMEMFVGVGASRVRDLFKTAKNNAPSIIFIDELDSIGRHRGAGLGGGHDEREQTLNQLLSELDGFQPNESVIVMAATNRPDILDPALLRPGRFDRKITVYLPSINERAEILKLHAHGLPLEAGIDFKEVARGTAGFSGADLQNTLNEAALIAARAEKSAISMQDIQKARDKVMMGIENRSLAIEDEEKKMIAYHEAGHAVNAAILEHTDPVVKVSIIPRNVGLGVTQLMPEKEKHLYTKEYLNDRIAVMLGGRAAEELIFETSTSGAENDLKEATKLARKMIADYGMGSVLKNIALSDHRQNVFLGEEIAQRKPYSEATASEIDNEIKALIEQRYQKALSVLKENTDILELVADTLMEKEEISGEEILGKIKAKGN